MSEEKSNNEDEGKTQQPRQQQNEQELEYNKKLSGYLSITLSSMVNFASISDMRNGERYLAMYGVVTFVISLFILAFDRVPVLQKKFDFKEIMDGKLEGYTLLFFVVWWIAGVGTMTKAGGVAYNVLNVYFSAWYTLGVCLYTLNKWSTEKDVISFHELTRLSATLSGWYALMIASLITLGSSANAYAELQGFGGENAILSLIIGPVSLVISIFYILIPYKLVPCHGLKHGDLIELFIAILLLIWWTLAVAMLTTDGSVASTIQGVQGCISVEGEEQRGAVPGSNLYFSLWGGLYATTQIIMRWKAAQAMVKMSVVAQRAHDVAAVKGKQDVINDEEDEI